MPSRYERLKRQARERVTNDDDLRLFCDLVNDGHGRILDDSEDWVDLCLDSYARETVRVIAEKALSAKTPRELASGAIIRDYSDGNTDRWKQVVMEDARASALTMGKHTPLPPAIWNGFRDADLLIGLLERVQKFFRTLEGFRYFRRCPACQYCFFATDERARYCGRRCWPSTEEMRSPNTGLRVRGARR